ncbi:type II toxin-antitoxin system PemK/MazF family toxin [Microbacterium halophytorum]|uniref:type II toxin-antitoxin system PemK/MazF family toxin n=1 Tax=Microbacterium halophytorum TaxID=2067568 RepID=UPI001572A7C0|nr:type II toxin-antitoxin system PemK/MazF family toxin [Microbacterium halophytorum]
MSQRRTLTSLIIAGVAALFGVGRRRERAGTGTAVGQRGRTATVELDPSRVRGVRLAYAPRRDGAPSAGEIVWTWVPYAENDGRGKDRPVLVIARQSADRVYAVKLTSKNASGRRDRVGIGSGPWDSQGRPSWVDTDQLYSVHHDGMRREAATLDLEKYTRVAHELQQRFGWKVK